MAISVADNFSYLGGKPLDGRIQYDTVANMKAMADAKLYEGCEAYCIATDKYYKWKSTNTVDQTLGKWREIESGGGSGGHTIQDDGTDMTARDNLNFVGFDVTDDSTNNRTTVAFPNINLSTLGVEAFRFSTDEKPVGQWTDGKLLYAKTVDCGTLPNNTTKTVSHGISNIENMCFIRKSIYGDSLWFEDIISKSQIANQVDICADTTNIYIADGKNYSSYTANVTLFYTKTTDTALDSNERFAGLTASGEVVYERTVTGNAASSDSSSATLVTISDIDSIVSASGMIKCSNTDKRAIPNMASSIEQVGTDVRFYCNSSSMYGKPVTATIRYTKSS